MCVYIYMQNKLQCRRDKPRNLHACKVTKGVCGVRTPVCYIYTQSCGVRTYVIFMHSYIYIYISYYIYIYIYHIIYILFVCICIICMSIVKKNVLFVLPRGETARGLVMENTTWSPHYKRLRKISPHYKRLRKISPHYKRIIASCSQTLCI